jgi:hypothetical protein
MPRVMEVLRQHIKQGLAPSLEDSLQGEGVEGVKGSTDEFQEFGVRKGFFRRAG